mgnify:CR=1 FL=1
MIRLTFTIFVFFNIVSCHAGSDMKDIKEKISVSFLIYNYSNIAIENVSINSQGSSSANAATKIGSVGSSGIVCCIDIPTSKSVKVKYSVFDNGSLKEKSIDVLTENSQEKNNSYAVFHFLPNNSGVLEFAMRPPSPRKDLLLKAINKQEIEVNFENGSMWNSKTENEMAHQEFPD